VLAVVANILSKVKEIGMFAYMLGEITITFNDRKVFLFAFY
jgi:hypothetical protein